MKEIFRQVDGYEDLYEISNQGRVRKITWSLRAGNTLHANKEYIHAEYDELGYMYIELEKDGNVETYKLMALVWEHFYKSLTRNLKIAKKKDYKYKPDWE